MVIYQPPKGYCYNSDTIFLYDFISRFTLGGKVLDVGSGSGILAQLIKRDFDADVSAVEVQERFVRYARINAAANRLPIKIYMGDFLQISFSERFDFIVSNPPFYHRDVLRSKDRSLDLARYSGHLPMERFFEKVSKLLKPRGEFLFCYDAKQIPQVISALRDAKLNLETMRYVHPKADRSASLALLRAKKGSRALCETLPPLVVFDGEEYAKGTKEIFRRVGVHSIKCEIK